MSKAVKKPDIHEGKNPELQVNFLKKYEASIRGFFCSQKRNFEEKINHLKCTRFNRCVFNASRAPNQKARFSHYPNYQENSESYVNQLTGASI